MSVSAASGSRSEVEVDNEVSDVLMKWNFPDLIPHFTSKYLIPFFLNLCVPTRLVTCIRNGSVIAVRDARV